MQAKDIRAAARNRLAGMWPLAIGAAAVACLLGGLIAGGSFLPDLEVREQAESLHYWDIAALIQSVSSAFYGAGALGLVSFIIGGVVQLGYAGFLLKQVDGQKPAFGDLFSQFDRFTVGFCQKFLRDLYTLLWGLLLIVPGIVASYSYAMTPFLLAENPGMGASEAIARSKQLMDGHKGELFWLDLTFIGWEILCALTMNLGNLALNPYRSTAYAVFYRNLTGSVHYSEVIG